MPFLSVLAQHKPLWTPSVLPWGPRVSSRCGKAAIPVIRNAGILACLLHPLQVEWECWGRGGEGDARKEGVPQPCTGLSGPQPCVEHGETSGSLKNN